METPRVATKDAQAFAKRWTHKGVAILLTDIQCEFAADFANIVLASFIEQARRDAAQRQAELNAPKIITES